MLTPVLATAFFAFGGLKAVIAFDLSTFAVAFLVLLLWIPIPEVPHTTEQTESCLQAAKVGLVYLRSNRGIFWLILFLSSINLIASMHPIVVEVIIPVHAVFRQVILVYSLREQLCWICHAVGQLVGSVLSETEK